MTRTKAAVKNISFNFISNVLTWILKFVSRTIFIKYIGIEYLGLNGLFTNLLGLLSFVELGIGSAINFSLYKPVVDKNTEKIKTLMHLYKIAYRYIALIVFIIGIMILPFLSYIIKDGESLKHIYLIYLFFLYDTVISYFAIYKTSLLNAEQKNYIWTIISSIFTIVIMVFQIISMVIFKNYIVFLIIGSFGLTVKIIFIYFYLDKLYPILKEKNVKKLDKTEFKDITKNVGALICHKIATISIFQTDNILISSFVTITAVGLLSNYYLLINVVSGALVIIFGSVTSSFGNLIASESKEKQLQVFNIYNSINFYFYAIAFLGLFLFSSRFISLWIGSEFQVQTSVLILIYANFYLAGQVSAIVTFRSASGLFKDDMYAAIAEAVINLVVSVIGAYYFGLIGIFIGTVVSIIFASVSKPILLYRKMFGVSCINYFKKFILYIIFLVLSSIILYCINTSSYLIENSIKNFLIVMCCYIIYILIFILIFRKDEGMKYIFNMIKKVLKKGEIKNEKH